MVDEWERNIGTSFDIARGVNYASPRASSTDINTDVMVHMWIEIVVRTRAW